MSRIKRVHCGDVNCHLVQGEQGAILVDTGRAGYGEKLLPLCRQWDVRLIVLTHGHLDHVQNAAFLSQQLEVPIAMHRADLELLEDNDRQPMQAHRRLGRLIQSCPGGGFRTPCSPPSSPICIWRTGTICPTSGSTPRWWPSPATRRAPSA